MEGALTGYATRILVHLARPQDCEPGHGVSNLELGRATRVPMRELDRVLGLLDRAGLVICDSGDHPCYRLKVCPWTITLMDLYRVTGELPFGSRAASSFTWGDLAVFVERELSALLKDVSIGRLAATQSDTGTAAAAGMMAKRVTKRSLAAPALS